MFLAILISLLTFDLCELKMKGVKRMHVHQ
jgi:hypothetical protein